MMDGLLPLPGCRHDTQPHTPACAAAMHTLLEEQQLCTNNDDNMFNPFD